MSEGMERCIENMQLNNRTKIANVDLKKREICVSTEKAVQEIKTFVDDAYAGWIKRFEQTHEDSVRILKVVYNELKRFSTIVHETKVPLEVSAREGLFQTTVYHQTNSVCSNRRPH